jgi:hypothetical protein
MSVVRNSSKKAASSGQPNRRALLPGLTEFIWSKYIRYTDYCQDDSVLAVRTWDVVCQEASPLAYKGHA